MRSIYDDFMATAEWPLMWRLEMEFEGEFPATDFEYECLQIGTQLVVCDNPGTADATCRLTLRGIEDVDPNSNVLADFVTVVAAVGEQYRNRTDRTFTLKTPEFTYELGLDPLRSRRVVAILKHEAGPLWRSASFPPGGEASFEIDKFASKVRGIRSVSDYLDRKEQFYAAAAKVSQARYGAPQPDRVQRLKVAAGQSDQLDIDLFLSHAAVDVELARLIEETVKSIDPTARVFPDDARRASARRKTLV